MMVLDFAQNLGQQRPLANLGANLEETVGGIRDRRARNEFNTLFDTYRTSPNQETGLALVQAGINAGLGPETMSALQMYAGEEGQVEDPRIRSLYTQTLDALIENPSDTRLRATLTTLTEKLGNFEETQYLLDNVLGLTDEQAAVAGADPTLVGARDAARQVFLDNPTPETAEQFLQASGLVGEEAFDQADAQIKMILDSQVTGPDGQTIDTSPVSEAFRQWKAGEVDWATVVQQANDLGVPNMAQVLYEQDVAQQQAQQRRQLENSWETGLLSIGEKLDRREQPTALERLEIARDGFSLGYGDSVNDILGTIDDLALAHLAEERRSEEQSAYEEFSANPSSETFNRFREASIAAGGTIDEVRAQFADVEEAQLKQDRDELGLVYGPLASNNIDAALDAIESLAETYRAEGDTVSLENILGVKQELEQGNVEDVFAELSVRLSQMGEEGQRAVDAALSMREETRAEARALREEEELGLERRMTDAELLRIGNSLEYPSEEAKQEALELASGFPGGVGEQVARLGSVVSQSEATGDPLDMRDIFNIEEGLRKEYDSYTQPYRDGMRAAEQIRRLVETDNASGFTDAALTTLFQKALDPESVVRESEAARTENAQGILDRAFMALERIANGQQYNPDARADILSAVDIVTAAYEEMESDQRTRLQNTLREVWGSENDRYNRSVERVFPPEPSNVTEADI